RDHRRLVTENVAEKVLGQHDVELPRVSDQLHGRTVDQLVTQRDVGIFATDLGHHLAPEPAGGEHVLLVDAADAAATAACELERDPGDPPDLLLGVDAGVDGASLRGSALAPLRTAEVQPARQLANDHEIDADDDLLADARELGE